VRDAALFLEPDIEASSRDETWYLSSRVPLGPFERSVGAVLERWAAATPDNDFLCERTAGGGWRRVTYGEAGAAARAIGQALLDRGATADHPVMVLSGNSIDHGLVMLGCYLAGVPIAPVSVAYSTMSQDFAKLRRIAATTQPALIVVDGDGAPFAGALAALRADGVTAEIVDDVDALLAATPGAGLETAAAGVGPDTTAKYLFTSGSTGFPKGVINTHGMLCANQQMLRQIWPFTASEPAVLLDWLPWSHTFAGNHDFNLVLWSGGTLYLDAGRPLPGLIDTTLHNLAEVSPTIYLSVPAGFAALVPHLEGDAALARSFFARLRLILYAGAALPAEAWRRLDALAVRTIGRSVPFTSSWGTTETAPLATSAHFPLDGPGNIGVPVPGTTVKLVPNGRKLELRVKGAAVTPGYIGEPELTAAAFDDEGFYLSGDAGRFADPDHPARGIVFDGRVVEDFKLQSGTWVSVGTLRPQLVGAAAGAVTDVVITGHDEPELGVLVWLSASGDIEQLRAAIERHNAAHPQSSTRIGRALVLTEPPSVDGHEITDKGYINQRAVLERRAADVARLHATDPDDDILLLPR